MNDTRGAAIEAEAAAAPVRTTLTRRTDQLRAQLQNQWDTDVAAAGRAGRVVAAGTGSFGRGRSAVGHAHQDLQEWAQRWQPVLDQIPTQLADPVALSAGWHRERVLEALDQQADRQALDQLPEQVQLIATAEQARTTAREAGTAYNQARGHMRERETVLHAAGGWAQYRRRPPPPGRGG